MARRIKKPCCRVRTEVSAWMREQKSALKENTLWVSEFWKFELLTVSVSDGCTLPFFLQGGGTYSLKLHLKNNQNKNHQLLPMILWSTNKNIFLPGKYFQSSWSAKPILLSPFVFTVQNHLIQTYKKQNALEKYS